MCVCGCVCVREVTVEQGNAGVHNQCVAVEASSPATHCALRKVKHMHRDRHTHTHTMWKEGIKVEISCKNVSFPNVTNTFDCYPVKQKDFDVQAAAHPCWCRLEQRLLVPPTVLCAVLRWLSVLTFLLLLLWNKRASRSLEMQHVDLSQRCKGSQMATD